MKEKSYVEDIDRSVYDFKDDEKDAYKLQAGLTPEIVEKLSKEKKTRYGCRTSVYRHYRFTMKCPYRTGDRRLKDWIWQIS